jgi:Xaa-Pro aminopeptidase
MAPSGTPKTDEKKLAALLTAAGVGMDMESLRDLVAGVAAASPDPRDGADWIDLVAPDAGDDLRGALIALQAEVAAVQPRFAFGPAPADRLAALRRELAACKLDGFLVPRTDEYQGEYVSARAERLRWLTGFAGSAGMAVVLGDKAAIFVDGRYTLQVTDEVDTAAFEPRHLIDEKPWEWVAEALPKGGRLGYDPWLQTQASVERYRRAVARAGGELVAVETNPVDAVWADQPPPPLAPVRPHDIAYAGKSAPEKRQEIGDVLSKAGADAAVLTMPDSIAWLLNVRGADVPHTPLPLSFAIVHKTGTVDWFVDSRKLAPGVAAHLGNGVAVEPPEAFGAALEGLGKAEAAVQVDEASAAAYVFDRLKAGGARIVKGDDPCALPKACKNAVEIDGARQAHERDGAALTRFLAWFAGEAPKGKLTEIAAADKLQGLRFGHELIRDLSFRTISGSGPNGAIVHYSVSAETDRTMQPGELYLVDSGAQYLDGTTDVTRTVAVGAPTAEMRDRFTRVLKGHIALATVRFPEGTTGSQLDVLARHALWAGGLDFDHGTGHGVGSFLGVHEGPHRISKVGNSVALKPGMIVSNEPGYYKTGAYGIRIENLVTVVPCTALEGAERKMFAFETLTLAPIDLNLVEPALMTAEEIAWLDAYHARVRDALGERMDKKTGAWLETVTRAVGDE